MKYRYTTAISFALVFLMLLGSSFGLVAALESPVWYVKEWAPRQTFTHYWNGTLLRTESGIQFWELYSELMMMMMPSMGGGVEWVKMTIAWNPLAQQGEIFKFEHHGENLLFTGWAGTIQFNPVYHFNVSGLGEGRYRVNGTWYTLIINGSFSGVYQPDNNESPFESGNSTATERATLRYLRYRLLPVGGEVVPVNKLALLAPWIVIAIAAITIGFTISKRKLYLH